MTQRMYLPRCVFAFVLISWAATSLAQNPAPTCDSPPLKVFGPRWLGGAYGEKYDGNDSHTFNPYSSKPNEVAGINHEAKKPGENGHWVTESFHVTCWGSDAMFKKTYINATITNSKGDPACQGGYITVQNTSSKYPAYYGLSGVLNKKVVPGQTQMLTLEIYRAKGDTSSSAQTVTLKYWAEEHATTHLSFDNLREFLKNAKVETVCPTWLDYYRSLNATPRPKYMSEIRNNLPWKMAGDLTFSAFPHNVLYQTITTSQSTGGVVFQHQVTGFPDRSLTVLVIQNTNSYPVFVDFYYSNQQPENAEYIALNAGELYRSAPGVAPCPSGNNCVRWTYPGTTMHVKVLSEQ